MGGECNDCWLCIFVFFCAIKHDFGSVFFSKKVCSLFGYHNKSCVSFCEKKAPRWFLLAHARTEGSSTMLSTCTKIMHSYIGWSNVFNMTLSCCPHVLHSSTKLFLIILNCNKCDKGISLTIPRTVASMSRESMDCEDDSVPDTPLSRALSQEVEKRFAELDQEEENELDELQFHAQSSEFCTVYSG